MWPFPSILGYITVIIGKPIAHILFTIKNLKDNNRLLTTKYGYYTKNLKKLQIKTTKPKDKPSSKKSKPHQSAPVSG